MADELETAPISALLRRIGLRMRGSGDDFIQSLAADTGLTAQQGMTIGWIEANEAKGVFQRELADVWGLRAASVTTLVQGLERDGWIERRSVPGDARKKTLHVTDKGRGITDAFDRMVAASEDQLLAPLTADERATLIALLKKIDTSPG